MYIEEDEDSYLTATNYSENFPLLGINGYSDSNIPRSPSFQHFSLNQLNSMLKDKKPNDFFALHINAVSLVANFDEIHSLISAKSACLPDVLCISESRLKDDKIEAQLQLTNIPEYNLAFDNSSTSAGGAAIYIRSTYNFSIKSESKLAVDDCESVFLEINLSGNSNRCNTFIIGCIYRHPRPNTDIFVEQLALQIEEFSSKNVPILILGDINIDVSSAANNKNTLYLETLSSLGCKNLIEGHTRISKTSRTTLDHIITNVEDSSLECGILNYTMTDHLPVFAIIKDSQDDPGKKGDSPKFWQKIDDDRKDIFLEDLQGSLSSICFDNHPEQIMDDLISKTKNSIDKCFPPKLLSNRAKKRSEEPWINKEVRKEENKQVKLFRKFCSTNHPDDYKNYNSFRKKLSKTKKEGKGLTLGS